MRVRGEGVAHEAAPAFGGVRAGERAGEPGVGDRAAAADERLVDAADRALRADGDVAERTGVGLQQRDDEIERDIAPRRVDDAGEHRQHLRLEEEDLRFDRCGNRRYKGESRSTASGVPQRSPESNSGDSAGQHGRCRPWRRSSSTATWSSSSTIGSTGRATSALARGADANWRDEVETYKMILRTAGEICESIEAGARDHWHEDVVLEDGEVVVPPHIAAGYEKLRAAGLVSPAAQRRVRRLRPAGPGQQRLPRDGRARRLEPDDHRRAAGGRRARHRVVRQRRDQAALSARVRQRPVPGVHGSDRAAGGLGPGRHRHPRHARGRPLLRRRREDLHHQRRRRRAPRAGARRRDLRPVARDHQRAQPDSLPEDPARRTAQRHPRRPAWSRSSASTARPPAWSSSTTPRASCSARPDRDSVPCST